MREPVDWPPEVGLLAPPAIKTKQKKKKDFVKQKQIKRRENGGEEILSERP